MIWVAGAALLVYAGAFSLYGRWLSRAFGLDDKRRTPAVVLEDGRDYVPTRPAILLGQHFAAIAAVGPIAGPIIAGAKYGWLPGMVWITLGAVFIGAVHDFAALMVSVRHGARSLGDVFRDVLGKRASRIFSLFIWLSLLYVIVVFADLTSAAFVSRPALGAQDFGPGVATTSVLYLGLAVALGLTWARTKAPLWATTCVFVPAILLIIAWGQRMPLVFPGDALAQQRIWNVLILAYCCVASLLPMGLLLQPRGYLGGFILYGTFAAGILGLLFGSRPIVYPAAAPAAAAGAPALFPLLFTTIACGACSGFHGLVCSGTTSKQLARETDARVVGYGGMLLESLVAVIAMSTVMILAPGSSDLGLGPDEVYARGLAHFMETLGIPFAAGVVFSKLAFATFIYDTLDVATRLGRYVVQETFGLRGPRAALAATLATVALPLVTVFMTFHDASGKAVPLWKMFWPAFGASNQLLAAMTLCGITVWLKGEGRNYWVTGVPAVFMTAVTLCSLGLLVAPWVSSVLAGHWRPDALGTTGLLLMTLALAYLVEVGRKWNTT